MSAEIRKIVVQVDEVHREMGRPINPPTRRALAIAVIRNPFAGQYVEQLDELIAIGRRTVEAELDAIRALVDRSAWRESRA